MNASVSCFHSAQKAVLVLMGIMGIVGAATAVPPTLNTSGLTPEQCYRRDSDCTRFCGDVTGDMRYECFKICDRMLDRCLATGDWSDSLEVDPGTGRPPDKGDLLSGFFLRVLMILGDTDGDGALSSKEIESVKDRVFRGVDSDGGATSPSTPVQQ